MDQAELIEHLRAAFAEEAAERLLSLRNSLVAMEKTASAEDEQALVEIVFREAHSLKGAARAVNLRNAEMLCQHLETAFSLLKRNKISLNPELFDIFHNCVKLLEDIIQNGGSDSAYKTDDIEFAIERLDNIQDNNEAGDPADHEEVEIEKPPTDQTSDFNSAQSSGGDNLLKDLEVLANNECDDELEQTSTEHLLPEISSETQLNSETLKKDDLAATDSVGLSNPGSPRPAFTAGVRMSAAKLDNLLMKTEELLSLKLISKEQLAHIKRVSADYHSTGKSLQQIDSEIRYLKKMVNKGEDHVNKDSNMERIGRFLTLVDSMMEDYRTFSRKLFEISKIEQSNSHVLERMIDGFSDDVKSAAMLPLHTLFQIYPGMVRDIARSQDKEIDLQINGAELEIDKRILEILQDPLTHVIRNSADHGIESRRARLEKGKREKGIIKLTVRQVDGNALEISVTDDGEGINFARVKDKAVAEGLLTYKDAEATTEPQLTSLIFHSGLSTSPIITELSGRGLGLAIVKERIESLGGNLSVSTKQGEGTTFIMRIPTTQTTLRGVLLKLGGEMFALPNMYIERAMKIDASAINRVKGKATVSIENEVLLLANLADILRISLPRNNETAEYNIMVLRHANAKMALIVDEICEEQEILIKKMGEQLLRVKNIAGATILGSGKIVPVLNVRDLFISAEKLSNALTQIEEKKVKRSRILLVEDSITSRMLIKNILEAAGYDVSTAVDGRAGFDFLRKNNIDLVVSDVEMPHMSGFELTEAIRGDKKLVDLPVILVTSLSTQKDQQKGIDAGANAYIVKGDFDQSNLLESIKRLI